MSPMERVDATLRQIDATLAACEPQIERAKALTEPIRPEPGPFWRFYASWLTIWRRLVWLMCLEWWPETRPHPHAKGLDVIVDTPPVPMKRGDLPPPDFRD